MFADADSLGVLGGFVFNELQDIFEVLEYKIGCVRFGKRVERSCVGEDGFSGSRRKLKCEAGFGPR